VWDDQRLTEPKGAIIHTPGHWVAAVKDNGGVWYLVDSLGDPGISGRTHNNARAPFESLPQESIAEYIRKRVWYDVYDLDKVD
jgi:hypothetical protein